MGLGLLGVAGALVNYWPVQGDLPVVASVLALPDRSGLPILHETLADGPAASRRALTARSHARAVVEVGLTIPYTKNANNNAVRLGAAPDRPASLDPGIVLPPSLAVTPAAMSAMPASTLDLMAPVITAFEVAPAAAPGQLAKNGSNKVASAAKYLGKASAWPFVALAHKLL
jgi:hypothetical protein